jgi:hypothetical protein
MPAGKRLAGLGLAALVGLAEYLCDIFYNSFRCNEIIGQKIVQPFSYLLFSPIAHLILQFDGGVGILDRVSLAHPLKAIIAIREGSQGIRTPGQHSLTFDALVGLAQSGRAPYLPSVNRMVKHCKPGAGNFHELVVAVHRSPPRLTAET